MFIVQWHNQKHDPPWEAALETVRKRGGGGALRKRRQADAKQGKWIAWAQADSGAH